MQYKIRRKLGIGNPQIKKLGFLLSVIRFGSSDN